LKKLQTHQDEDLEDPEFDPAFIQPQRVVDQDEHELIVEISDEELLEWEKGKRKEEAEMLSDEEPEVKVDPMDPLVSTVTLINGKEDEIEGMTRFIHFTTSIVSVL
jgi:hypothetical protein